MNATWRHRAARCDGVSPALYQLLDGAVVVVVAGYRGGDQGADVVGASEIKGQAFAWGKGERMLKEVIDKAEQLAGRY